MKEFWQEFGCFNVQISGFKKFFFSIRLKSWLEKVLRRCIWMWCVIILFVYGKNIFKFNVQCVPMYMDNFTSFAI